MKRKCNGCDVTTYDTEKDFECAKCHFKYIAHGFHLDKDKCDKCEHELNLTEEYVFSGSSSREVTLTCDLCGIKYKGIVFRSD